MTAYEDGINDATNFVIGLANDLRDFGDEVEAEYLEEIAEGIQELKNVN